MELYAGYYRAPRGVDETLALVGLDAEAAAKIAATLSGGQRRRLDVALALIGDPELIFLDEPTTGFDPAARRDAWEMLDGLRELGKTIFLTTHYMEEAERLADRIAVIAGGRIVDEGTPPTIGGRATSPPRRSSSRCPADDRRPRPAGVARRARQHAAGRPPLIVPSATVAADLHALSGWALDRDLELDDLEVAPPDPRGRLPAAVATEQRGATDDPDA